MRQPLEWMLAQDGVGQIVAVGHESPHNVSFLLRDSPQKVATNYARAHTSTIQQTLDRGTPNPADDVFLEKGQSWITVSSPTEGTSHITVWAPKEHHWERRKAFATIYWVDAAWRFPPCVTVRAGNKQALQTVVTRAGGQPVSGWIVRYEVLDGPPAAFGMRGERAIEVRTDAAGRATAELLPLATQPGITMVGIQVVRPGTARGDLPEMIVGQGTTSVQWTTPGLSVRAIGTSTVAADGAVSYRVEVTNNGDLPTRGVAVSYDPPPGVSILNSAPPAQVFGQRYEWRLGDLPPRTTSVLELNCRAAVAASIRSTFRATSAGGLSVEGGAATEVFHNALSVKMTGPETAVVGREAKFLIEVTNTGETPLTNVVATDTFEPGLRERHGAQSPAVKSLAPSLAPGETHRFALTFVVAEPGRHCHRLSVTADGGHTAATQGCLTATAPIATPPQLSVRVNGPRSVRPGEIADCTVEVVNGGTGPATNVVLLVHTAASLELDRATPGFDHDPARGVTEWRLARLAGGESLRRQLQFKAVAVDEAALVRATVASEQTASVAGETAVRIASVDSPSPYGAARPQTSASDAPTTDGGLRIAIAETADPVSQGDVTTYILTIVNDRDTSDRDVTVHVEVTGGLKITRIPSSPTAVVRTDERRVEFATVREVRAGEQLPPFRIEVQGTTPGRHKLQVKVTSTASPDGVFADSETTVAAP
jgi:uncharacterized repeat protein (TIGR01451 family)